MSHLNVPQHTLENKLTLESFKRRCDLMCVSVMAALWSLL